MSEIFVSSKKQELKPDILLEISSGITNLSKMINVSGITTMNTSFTSGLAIFSCLDAGYLDILASVFVSVNASNMSTHSGDFSGFPQPSLSDDKVAKDTNRVACIGAAGIGSIYTRDTCARSTSAGNTFFARSACIKGAFVGDTHSKNTYARDASAIKYLGMHS